MVDEIETDIDNDGHGGNELGQAALEGEVLDALEGAGFPGGHTSLEKLKRPGAVFSGGQRQSMSVLQQYITAIMADEDYRRELKRANWDSIEEADNWCAAYQECQRYGAPVDWLIDRLIAHSAGVSGGSSLLKTIMETISHTTLTMNSNGQQQKQKNFFRRNNGNGKGPLIE